MANFFPRWTNWLPLKIAVCGIAIVCGLTAGTWYYATPKYTKVGYEPIQPVPFPHDIHVSQLGMDCRYCHSFVDVAAQSNVPNTQTCMACHQQVQKDNPKLEPVRDSWKTGKPIEWVWLHRTVDYVYYNHAAHVNRGISCFSCHGAVNHMPVVYMAKPHSMAWCCLLYTSDAADERSSVDLGGRRIIKKKTKNKELFEEIQRNRSKH